MTVPDIEKIAAHYTQTLSIKATALRTGYAFETVQRYVEDGDPKRGIPSIKSTLAQRIHEPTHEPAKKRIAYSVGEAFESSTNVMRLVKSLFSAKFGSMLRELDDAYKSGDAKRISAAQENCFPHIKVADVARLAVAEAVLFEKMGPKEQGGGSNQPLPPDIQDEVNEILDELAASGVLVEDDERYVAPDDEPETDLVNVDGDEP